MRPPRRACLDATERLSAIFEAAGHDAHSVVEQALGGQPDERVINVCNREQRAGTLWIVEERRIRIRD